jgi:iron complex outermembrane receptor protein
MVPGGNMNNKNPANGSADVRHLSLDVALLSLATAISVVLLPSAALAQDAELQETVIVTGSRIARGEFSAASPILTVDRETFDQSSTLSVESVLNQLPQFIPDGSQFTTAEVEPSAFTSPGISNVNLRGLGSNRNLVLVNGRRMQPANATLVVDVSTIPNAAIASVEAISGGASSVYGADAISGVVNFVLRDDYEGIQVDLETTTTDQGGGQETRVSALIGGNFSDGRGNIMFGGEWTERRAVYQRQRDFIVDGWLDPGTTAGAVSETYWSCTGRTGGGCPTQTAVNTVYADVADPDTVSPTATTYINDDGTVFQAVGPISYTGDYGLERKIMTLQDNTLGEVNTRGYASSPSERYSIFGRAIYDVNDSIRAFV